MNFKVFLIIVLVFCTSCSNADDRKFDLIFNENSSVCSYVLDKLNQGQSKNSFYDFIELERNYSLSKPKINWVIASKVAIENSVSVESYQHTKIDINNDGVKEYVIKYRWWQQIGDYEGVLVLSEQQFQSFNLKEKFDSGDINIYYDNFALVPLGSGQKYWLTKLPFFTEKNTLTESDLNWSSKDEIGVRNIEPFIFEGRIYLAMADYYTDETSFELVITEYIQGGHPDLFPKVHSTENIVDAYNRALTEKRKNFNDQCYFRMNNLEMENE